MNQMKIFFGTFSETQNIFTCFPSNQTLFYVHKNKEVNPCNYKILTHGPLSYLFQEMKPPFIESKKSICERSISPSFQQNDKRSLN